MIPTLIRRAAAAVKPPPAAQANLYRTKKVWPPDFSKLSAQEQFRFEKRYKRRVKHISARPRWNKMVKLAQLFSITGRSKCQVMLAGFRADRRKAVVFYSVLFMSWNGDEEPFAPVSMDITLWSCRFNC